MDIIRARQIVRLLAEGVDPLTGEVLSNESVFNKPDVIRALYTILEVTAPKTEVPKPAKTLDPKRNAGKPWTEVEDDKLRDEFAEKMNLSDIAKEHGRTYGAIEGRLEHLGLKKKSFWLFRRKNK